MAGLRDEDRLASMLAVVQSVAAGDFSARARKEKNDVLGMLAVGINMMVDEIEELVRREHRRSNQLEASLSELRRTQAELVQREKMAALGNLVAGIAHEVNTPLGVSLTALTIVQERAKTISERFEAGTLKKSDLQSLLGELSDATSLAFHNGQRAATLISSFKQVAVDQASEQRRRILLVTYLREVIESLRPVLRKYTVEVVVEGDDCELDTFPGAISQVFTNLVSNSLMHGLDPAAGAMSIVIRVSVGPPVHIRYSDTGRGMAPETLRRIFEPFFTTRRGKGGSGLGMHIVHNLVTDVLKGTISVTSQPGTGTAFDLRFPATPAATATGG